ncbi:radical SAM protein [Candidatus Omnitrophota bacterium]
MSKKVFILSNGCPENRLDVAQVQNSLSLRNWEITSRIKESDLIVFNTCALTCDAENLSLEIVKNLEMIKNKSAQLIVSGCLPKINQQRLQEVYGGCSLDSDTLKEIKDIIDSQALHPEVYANSLIKQTTSFGNSRLKKMLLKKRDIFDLPAKIIEVSRKKRSDLLGVCRPHTFCIKVSTGCLCQCTFCAVRFSRGVLRSKSIHDIVKEFKTGLSKGYKEFALIGTDVGAYGRDRKSSLVELLKQLTQFDGEYKIRLRNIQPKFLLEMISDLRPLLKTGKISFIGSALESGSDRVLALMRRGYGIKEAKGAVRSLSTEFPDIQLRTQLMVGFPTETDQDFSATKNLLDELFFDFVEIYLYQPRPKTDAASLKGQVPMPVAKRRYFELLLKAFMQEHRGRRKVCKNQP